jgi:hypothetical protein
MTHGYVKNAKILIKHNVKSCKKEALVLLFQIFDGFASQEQFRINKEQIYQ